MRLLSNPSGGGLVQFVPGEYDLAAVVLGEVIASGSSRRTARRLTADEVDALVAVYRSGASVPQLVKQFGVNRTTVLAHLERRGIPRRPCVAKLTEDEIAAAARDYGDGKSLAKLGAAFGVNAETIRRALLRVGVEIRPRRGWSPSG
jgi:hypothetical protein